MKLLVDDLKRPLREAEAVEQIIKGADEITQLMFSGYDLSATTILLSEMKVVYHGESEGKGKIVCKMGHRVVDSETEDDPLWLHAMEFRLTVSKILEKVGSLWRASIILSLSEQLAAIEEDTFSYTIEGDVFQETQGEIREGIIQKYDAFAASLLELGLIGIWSQQPLINGSELISQDVLPNVPKGPIFREIMDEQKDWMITHPGGGRNMLIAHLRDLYPEYA
jgi:hypothetical protein